MFCVDGVSQVNNIIYQRHDTDGERDVLESNRFSDLVVVRNLGTMESTVSPDHRQRSDALTLIPAGIPVKEPFSKAHTILRT